MNICVCELCETCIFFNDKMPDMPEVAEYLKDKYCRKNHHQCARFQVYRLFGRENVPSNLFPNEEELVPEINAALERRFKK